MINDALFEYLEGYLTDRRRALFLEVLQKRTKHFTVATEGVYQLHNTSAVIRSCDVFGIQDVHVVEDIQGNRIDKEIAMGAQKWVDLHRYDTVQDCVSRLKSEGYRIVATSPHGQAITPEAFDISKKSAFFFGKESDGLSPYVLKQADTLIKIPMYGFTESLNISVSAAIILQNVVSRLHQSEISWQLSPSQIRQKQFDWMCKTIKSIDAIIERFEEENS
ncbi:MAG: RNA methyltransferase [Gilvibacter sp.]